MDSNRLHYYKESGIAPPLNVALVMTCGLLIILFVSYFYSLIITYIPIVYLNFLIVMAYGFVISFTSKIFNTIFKIRNRRKSIGITIILAVFGIYFQWTSFLFVISNEPFSLFMIFEHLDFFFSILLRPDLVVLNMLEINKVGLWSLGFSGINATGIFLWIIWLAEAVIIAFTAYKSFVSFEEIPFSERDDSWFNKETIDFDFEHIAFKKKFVDQFAQNPSEAISGLGRGDGLRHSKISIFKSKTESKSLISIDNIRITQKGKGKKDVTKVLKYCYIDNLHLSKLRTAYNIKKASRLDY